LFSDLRIVGPKRRSPCIFWDFAKHSGAPLRESSVGSVDIARNAKRRRAPAVSEKVPSCCARQLFGVIDSEQFSLRRCLSSRAKIYEGGFASPGPTSGVVSECFSPRILCSLQPAFPWVTKMKGKKKATGRAEAGKKLRSQTVTETFSASRS